MILVWYYLPEVISVLARADDEGVCSEWAGEAEHVGRRTELVGDNTVVDSGVLSNGSVTVQRQGGGDNA